MVKGIGRSQGEADEADLPHRAVCLLSYLLAVCHNAVSFIVLGSNHTTIAATKPAKLQVFPLEVAIL